MITTLPVKEIILDASKEVFETMIFMDVEKYEDESFNVYGPSVMGVITFKGQVDGCLTIYTTEACSNAIAKNMLGMEPDEEMSRSEMSDAIGEVTNMVMGSIKTRMQEFYPDFEVSIPSVFVGVDMHNTIEGHKLLTSVSAAIDEQHTVEFSLHYKVNSK